MIYLNNSATSYPKPQCVIDAHTAALTAPPFAQYRGTGFVDDNNIFDSCRSKLGELLQISDTKRIFFSFGATDALNAIINGLNLSGKQIITTQTEHNSVLRPLLNVYNKEDVTIVSCDVSGRVEPLSIESMITKDTGAIIVNHCSNVTGVVQDIEVIGEIAQKHNLIFVVDASQSAGCAPIKTDDWGIDILVFTGHKSLFGVQGTGGYYVKKGIELLPFRYGGTGKNSLQLTYENGNYEYEVGTQNASGAAALDAGVGYILERGLINIINKENYLIKKVYDEFLSMENVKVYGDKLENHGPVISFNIIGLKSTDVAFILSNSYNIIVRAGIHCAPLIHDKLGTREIGTVRVSISDFTTEEEINELIEAVDAIQKTVSGV